MNVNGFCEENRECNFSAQLKTLDGRTFCSTTTAHYFRKTSPPDISFFAGVGDQILGNTASGVSQTVIISRRSKGVLLKLVDDPIFEYFPDTSSYTAKHIPHQIVLPV